LLIVFVTAAVLALKSSMGNKIQPGTPTTGENASAPGSTDDVKSLIARVAKHIIVNPNEEPTIATIENADLLKQQSPLFYKDAQNGDRLLVWSDKAILYSPSRDIILAALPVSAPPASSSTTPTADATEEATIEVRNGTLTAGLGRSMSDKLKAAGLTVLPPTDAKVKTYEQTVIIIRDSSKPLPKTLETLKAITGAQIIDAPAAEGVLKGDFLVILGANFTP
jgi:hypothetical protein